MRDDRFAALEASLTTHDNGYARVRLTRYRAWMELPEIPFAGGNAFYELPLQRAPGSGFGLQHLVDGKMTCATCHSYRGVAGSPNLELDLGAAIIASAPHAPPESRAIALAWGPGRVDVSSAAGNEPARIPDLRPVRYQRFLQYSGAVTNTAGALELRIETLIITSTHETARPSHAVVRALSDYVESLADTLPASPVPPAVFTRECAGCHEGSRLIDADDVGTDPTLARSPDRGTGKYRAPTLRGVSLRAPLMHDASVATLDALLDDTRLGGHRFGLELPSADRASLLGYLRRL